MKHHIIIGYCLIILTSCLSKQQSIKKIEVIYCPEINNKNSFCIPKDITDVFRSKNIDGVNYEVISDSKIKIISNDFNNPVEVPIFNSLSQTIFGTPSQSKTNELITTELHTIKFDKKNSRKSYPSDPSENQIFIYYNTKNLNTVVGRKYYLNSSEKISNVISKFITSKKNIYIFNSPPFILQTKSPSPPTVRNTKISVLKNSTPIVLKALKSPGCYLKWSNINGNAISPKISTDRTGIFQYYVSQQDMTTKLESKQIQIVVTVNEITKPTATKPKTLLPFSKKLSIDKDGSGHLLNWNHPIKTNQIIDFRISFINNDTKESFYTTTLHNQKTFNISGLAKIDFLKRREFPKRGVTFTVTANLEGYTPLTEDRQISFMYDKDDKLTIWNCYTR
jgi:hypothetical protein